MTAIRHRSDAVGLVVSALAFVLISLPVSSHSVPGPERSVFRVLNTGAVPYSIVWAFMQLGDVGIFPIAAGIAAAFRRWRLAFSLALAGGAAYLGGIVVKDVVKRGRPAALLPHVLQRGAHEGGLGYVSGHAALVTALFVVAWPYLSPSWRWVTGTTAAIVGWTRVDVGVHLPLDIAGGIALGAAIGFLVRLLLGRPAPAAEFRRPLTGPTERSVDSDPSPS